jgi:tetratricopeptide (TPR) repeat protein
MTAPPARPGRLPAALPPAFVAPGTGARFGKLAAAFPGALAAMLALAAALALEAPGPAVAQVVWPDRGGASGSATPESPVPFYFSVPSPSETPRASRPVPSLSPALSLRLRRAQDLRLAGLPERALDTLRAVQREAPHHPFVVLELARTHMAREDWASAWGLLRAERSASRDSLLGSAELELTCERLARPRDAAQVCAETWAASPPDGQWALAALLRLLPQDARATSEALRAATAALPERGDLARGYALLLSRQGRPGEAARALAASDRPGWRPPLRQWFADEALFSGLAADSVAAAEALVSLAADTAFAPVLRVNAAHRALQLTAAHGSNDGAPRLVRALAGVPVDRWGEDLLLALVRALRVAGRGGEARALLARAGELLRGRPELALERAWAQMREGPPAAAVPALDSLARGFPPARFPLAEAQFFAGQLDSALANYRRAALDESSPDAVPALDRAYLLEEHPGDGALRAFGELAFERWRGGSMRALRLADSLWRALPLHSPYHAQAALQLAELRGEARDWNGALVPLAVVADSLPGDRLAPVARQRVGEALLAMGDERRALQQFEECLARYPRAWNAPEVRRYVEKLRRDRRL